MTAEVKVVRLSGNMSVSVRTDALEALKNLAKEETNLAMFVSTLILYNQNHLIN